MLHSRLLKYLDEVARLGSIRKASVRLNVASSAINRQILALENELGTPIFERMPRRLRLTATGEVLIAHVRETLKGHQRVEAHIEALEGSHPRRGDDRHHERARGRSAAARFSAAFSTPIRACISACGCCRSTR